MAMTANDRMELWTIGVQAIVLSIGFALIFSWSEDWIPKTLAAVNLVLLVLIYAMPDRLRNSLQKEIKELHKAHGFTQTMILELRASIPDRVDLKTQASVDQFAKAQEMAERFDTFRSEFEKGFEESFQHERSVKGVNQNQFFADIFGTTAYLSALIGGSVLLGWLISSFF